MFQSSIPLRRHLWKTYTVFVKHISCQTQPSKVYFSLTNWADGHFCLFQFVSDYMYFSAYTFHSPREVCTSKSITYMNSPDVCLFCFTCHTFACTLHAHFISWDYLFHIVVMLSFVIHWVIYTFKWIFQHILFMFIYKRESLQITSELIFNATVWRGTTLVEDAWCH